MHEYLMRLYAKYTLKKIYIERESVCVFGILYNKWRIVHRAMNVSEHFTIAIVKACYVVHNCVRDRDGFRYEDT
ncbi:hypothetical protein PR048_022638 [Dryococelus australis]|uniref:DDE Tnp4 domain-containing protein n=1 Tax=Dryococelus australis TaxID=614101 RepID=A0ABQ9H1M4_9NEOP|nr:hypothetical protein PR048_022638 [Dryococelus australis]